MYTINIKAAEKAKKIVLKYGHIIFSIYPEVCVIFYYAQIIKVAIVYKALKGGRQMVEFLNEFSYEIELTV